MNDTDKQTSNIDKIYASSYEEVDRFRFDEAVTAVFPDMINRSVPGYQVVVQMLGVLAKMFVKDKTNVYDLGCSLGAASVSILEAIRQNSDVDLIAVDNSAAMVSQLRENLSRFDTASNRITLLQDDIQNIDISTASMVVLNYTLQFIPPDQRQNVIKKIYAGIIPGGCLVISEKILFDDEQEGQYLNDQHLVFKKSNGYSNLEISQKRSSLENVLISETIDQHRQRLLDAGFSECYKWFQCCNFVSLVAIK